MSTIRKTLVYTAAVSACVLMLASCSKQTMRRFLSDMIDAMDEETPYAAAVTASDHANPAAEAVSDANTAATDTSVETADAAETAIPADEAEPAAEPVPDAEPTPAPEPAPAAPSPTAQKRQEYEQRYASIRQYYEALYPLDHSQQEMNQLSIEEYQQWDALLNEIYQYLKTVLPEDRFSALQKDEINWIREKEAAVKEAGAACEGGSIQPTVEYGTASEYTEERCRYLISLIP